MTEMTKRTDWENVNMGCMFVCMNEAVNNLSRAVTDDDVLSEHMLSEEDREKISEVILILDRCRNGLVEMMNDMFVEDARLRRYGESEDESEEQKEENDEYNIVDDDEAVKAMMNLNQFIIALCRRKK